MSRRLAYFQVCLWRRFQRRIMSVYHIAGFNIWIGGWDMMEAWKVELVDRSRRWGVCLCPDSFLTLLCFWLLPVEDLCSATSFHNTENLGDYSHEVLLSVLSWWWKHCVAICQQFISWSCPLLHTVNLRKTFHLSSCPLFHLKSGKIVASTSRRKLL